MLKIVIVQNFQESWILPALYHKSTYMLFWEFIKYIQANSL